ncbi:MFS general substrate transporter [Auriscalpium vulgare]|uniref:MFS general substrate transporter n=1 Tax=Auriscalpium vulgare TaxID=40419 RepID=A0ACB8S4A9_9AGAM|nr:MFS general substrate transporter [Auriscalpium vulgare]
MSTKTSEARQATLVTFAAGDPGDPVNWTFRRKLATLVSLCILSFCSVFGSSCYAPGQPLIQELYHVNIETSSAGLSLYVLGFAVGPLLFRFFTGCAAACALNNGSGVITDMFHNDIPAQSLGASFCPLSGPCFGSIVGFFVAAAEGKNLWVVRVHFFFAIACWPLVFLLPESHGPTILLRRARALRAQGQSDARAPQEVSPESRQEILKKNILRPTRWLLSFFFSWTHNIPFRLCGLMFIPIPIGMLMIVGPYPQLTRLFARMPLPWIERKGVPLKPAESRLKVVLSACLLLPISMFWFAWTSGHETHWIAPALAGIAFGYSMMAIFMCFLAYVSQTYTIYASSAVACNTFARSIIGAIFPVAAHRIFTSMGTKWGLSLFGFLSLGLIPIPLIFIRYGEQLRERSHFAKEGRAILAGLQAAKDEPMDEKTQFEAERKSGEKMEVREESIV